MVKVKINATMLPLVAVPLTVMLMRMSEAAGIDPKLSTDNDAIPIPEIALSLKGKKLSSNKVSKAVEANQKSKDLAQLPKRPGLMSKPERIV